MSFRFKQIGLSLCLMASLLVGSASACACSHHQETKKAEVSSCHGNEHEQVEAVEGPIGTTTIDIDCECFVSRPSPVIVAKSETKKSKTSGEVVEVAEIILPNFTFVAAMNSMLPESAEQIPRSTILESLLPARAPPRL